MEAVWNPKGGVLTTDQVGTGEEMDVHNGLREKEDEEGVGGRIRAYAEACDCDERQCQWQWNIMKLDILGEAERQRRRTEEGRD
jgi:hypothetical protein